VQINELELDRFRNYEHASVTFGPGLNLIKGRNAQGKTNLLEAVHCLGGLGSPRGPDSALVKEGEERAVIHAGLERGGRELRVDMEIRPGRGTRALLNKTPLPRTRSLSEIAQTVFFGPDELSLVKGSPDGRRRFLDELGIKLRPARHALRREWDRVLKQRNALLKSAPRGSLPASTRQTLEIWDETFCRVGAAVTAARLETLGHLLPFSSKRYEEIAGAGRLELTYSSAWLDEGASNFALGSPSAVDENALRVALENKLQEVRKQELERGLSLIGPQRDDITVLLASGSDGSIMEARTFASQGDQRTCALSLKLAEHDLVTETLGEEPILLLDDVFSELDSMRRGWLQNAVKDMTQTLVSSAEASATDVAGASKVFEVAGGRVAEV
jgi:DNA replication and repair protein RecF